MVCAALGRNAKVSYPPPGSDIPIVASTDEITADAQHAEPPPGGVAALQQQLITQAVTEQDLLGDVDAITTRKRERFWDFQNRVNASSARPPAYLDACEMLHLDPRHPSLLAHGPGNEATWELLPHQVRIAHTSNGRNSSCLPPPTMAVSLPIPVRFPTSSQIQTHLTVRFSILDPSLQSLHVDHSTP